MSFFNSKLRYALYAAVDLAMQPPTEACQSREIAARQSIPGPYLDQILAALKGAGIVRSIRGAAGGYTLARAANRISVGDVTRALLRGDRLVAGSADSSPSELSGAGVAWVVRQFEEQVEADLTRHLDSLTLADLAQRKTAMEDSLSIMPDI